MSDYRPKRFPAQPGAPLKLIDFGLAIHLNKNENATEVCGTTSYMAPEVLHGNYSMECDVSTFRSGT